MIKLTNKNWKVITNINRKVNFEIDYLSDREHYAQMEYWVANPPDSLGDCEDKALTKQSRLKAEGIPSFMATCTTETGGGHGVLLIDTDKGTFVLDNRYETVYHYEDLPYKWRKREINKPGKYEGNKWVEILS